MRMTRNSTLSDEKWTLLDVEDCSFETEITEGKASVTSGILRAEICDLPWGAYALSFYKNSSLILRTHDEGEYTLKFEHTEGQNYRTRIIFDARDVEHTKRNKGQPIIRQMALFPYTVINSLAMRILETTKEEILWSSVLLVICSINGNML